MGVVMKSIKSYFTLFFLGLSLSLPIYSMYEDGEGEEMVPTEDLRAKSEQDAQEKEKARKLELQQHAIERARLTITHADQHLALSNHEDGNLITTDEGTLTLADPSKPMSETNQPLSREELEKQQEREMRDLGTRHEQDEGSFAQRFDMKKMFQERLPERVRTRMSSSDFDDLSRAAVDCGFKPGDFVEDGQVKQEKLQELSAKLIENGADVSRSLQNVLTEPALRRYFNKISDKLPKPIRDTVSKAVDKIDGMNPKTRRNLLLFITGFIALAILGAVDEAQGQST